MTSVAFLRSDILVAGWSCRLPGAESIGELWSLLDQGRCSITSIPADRWSLDRFGHPDRHQPGKSYTWAAGVLADPWGFDAGVFAISPREAAQMDPQQRILLELTWEALEDAGIPPSALEGSEVGVYIGASSTDQATMRTGDPASGDLHFATGNALSILANRISYAFDFKGPSLTIDTACSSSMVALHHAVEALRSRRVDVAIVGGINVLASPFTFIGFSHASMLSPTGRCRPFSADADGYVRAEGGAVLVLRRLGAADRSTSCGHGLIVATDVNSDGRTAGIALPSQQAQQRLMERIYARAQITPDQVAFVEAHGTGTAAGDPIEAAAIGQALARRRAGPLPIGSVKSNIGHLEPAAGLAGVIKALLALKHGRLPSSLHFAAPNPNIPFQDLNLRVVDVSEALGGAGSPHHAAPAYAGVNSFGFGGTNAHAVVAALPTGVTNAARSTAVRPVPLLISAESRSALAELARRYAATIGDMREDDVAAVAGAAAYRRQLLGQRLLVEPAAPDQMAAALTAVAEGGTHPLAFTGTADAACLPIAFVFSGNGSQWVGMGRSAYRANAQFQAAFDETDRLFCELAGWSLVECLNADDLAVRLPRTSIAQPLIFAIQVASCAALRAQGVHPVAVLGHSVGEVAAAYVAGALQLADAVDVIHYRSLHQELVAGAGDMAVLLAAPEVVEDLARGIGGLEIAAFNSASAIAVAGTASALSQISERAADRSIRCVPLQLGYPFHSAMMAPVEAPLLRDLARLSPRTETTPFVSTVTGSVLDGARLGADYWWRNVRDPVAFHAAVRVAAGLGARYFIEIGPRATLSRHVIDCLAGLDGTFQAHAALQRDAETGSAPIVQAATAPADAGEIDPIRAAVATALVQGAAIGQAELFGSEPVGPVVLPRYPWQHRQYRFTPSVEGIGYAVGPWHPLAGGRHTQSGLEWYGTIDTQAQPELADHVVAGQPILPGSAFVEIALSVARQWLKTDDIQLVDLEILKPLGLGNGDVREIQTRVSTGSSTLEISSRKRLTTAGWVLHARAKVLAEAPSPVAPIAGSDAPSVVLDQAAIYELAARCGLDYGPAFRLAERAGWTGALAADGEGADTRLAGQRIELRLAACASAPARPSYSLDPMRVDACFHGLFSLFTRLGADRRGVAYVPVRFDEISYFADRGAPDRAVITIRRAGSRSILADFQILDSRGDVAATLTGARFAALVTRRARALIETALIERLRPVDVPGSVSTAVASLSPAALLAIGRGSALATAPDASAHGPDAMHADPVDALSDGIAMLEGWATAVAGEIAGALADDGVVSPDDLTVAGRLPRHLTAWLAAMLDGLTSAGLAEIAEESSDGPGDQPSVRRWRLLPEPDLPSAADVLAALAADVPGRAPELLLAGEVTMLAGRIAAARALSPEHPASRTSTARTFYEAAGRDRADAEDLATRLLAARCPAPGDGHAIRVLILDAGGLAGAVHALPFSRDLDITVLDADVAAADDGDARRAMPGGAFDVVVTAGGLDRLSRQSRLAALERALKPGGMLIAVGSRPTLFRDVVFGLPESGRSGKDEPDFDPSDARSAPSPRTPAQWLARLKAAGFGESAAEHLIAGETPLLAIAASAGDAGADGDRSGDHEQPSSAAVAVAEADASAVVAVVYAAQAGSPLVDALARCHDADPVPAGRLMAAVSEGGIGAASEVVVVLPADAHRDGMCRAGGAGRDTAAVDPIARIIERCLDLQAVVRAIAAGGGRQRARLWVVHEGCPSTSSLTRGQHELSPVDTAIWAYCRTLANEHAQLDIRSVGVAADVSCEAVAERLARIISHGTAETQLRIAADTTHAVRVEPLPVAAHLQAGSAQAAGLHRSTTPGQRLQWRAIERLAPGPGEVEIEVEATGLNFRDLMWSMDLLPDDMLEHGFTGPTLGLECAGRVVRKGAGVEAVAVGDRVVSMAPMSFATHAVLDQGMLLKVPAGMSAESAATIPVAFLTAWYGLVTLARLERDDWVLVHGAAGAVGLAAGQIAGLRGARMIATAGSPAKRDMLRALGVEHVLDSRSTAFVADIRAITGDGVDVVLNSLAKEAMERSLQCLRPFGRFVELGKRDYVENTHVGLRPFRRNLSYFGVDVDQLIGARRDLGRQVIAEIGNMIGEGTVTPLPHSVFPAARVADAFQLMQQSAHIGKIVVRPPDVASIPAARAPFAVDAARTHLVTGAFGGFGLATVSWLVSRGARHLVLIGRRGAVDDEAGAELARLAALGVEVLAAPCDVADEAAVAALLDRVRAEMPPLAGVVHAAMVLEDGLAANLDADQLQRVLSPKVGGADVLDRLTRAETLDYFVMYSSVTTLIGNPGQAAYVAANAYMEGLARSRRRAGLPALAVGWGPILDVGVLARDRRLRDDLLRRLGMIGLAAADALDLMGEALALAADDPALAVVTIAPLALGEAATVLPVLASPTYAAFLLPGSGMADAVAGSLDLRDLVVREGASAARSKVMALIALRLARVLRTREHDLDARRPLSQMGLDSLMALELAGSLEHAFGMPVALDGGLGGLTIATLADRLIAQVGSDGTARSGHDAVSATILRHVASANAEDIGALQQQLARVDRAGRQKSAVP